MRSDTRIPCASKPWVSCSPWQDGAARSSCSPASRIATATSRVRGSFPSANHTPCDTLPRGAAAPALRRLARGHTRALPPTPYLFGSPQGRPSALVALRRASFGGAHRIPRQRRGGQARRTRHLLRPPPLLGCTPRLGPVGRHSVARRARDSRPRLRDGRDRSGLRVPALSATGAPSDGSLAVGAGRGRPHGGGLRSCGTHPSRSAPGGVSARGGRRPPCVGLGCER